MQHLKDIEWKKIVRTFVMTISILSVAFLLYSIFVRNTYPPPDGEIAKKFHFILACGVISLSTLILIVFTERHLRLKLNLLDGLVVVFALYILLNSWLNDSPARTSIAILMTLAVLYFNIRVIAAAEKKVVRYWVILLLFVGLGQVYIGSRQLYGLEASGNSNFSLTGSFYNPGPYAGLLAVIFALSLYETLSLYTRVLSKFWPVKNFKDWFKAFANTESVIFFLSILAGITILIIIPHTMSRTAWLAMIISSVLVLASRFGWISKLSGIIRGRKILSVISIAMLIVMILVIVSNMYNIKRGSADGRLMIWNMSTRIICHNPAFGTGIGKFGAAYGEEQIKYFADKDRTDKEIATAECPEMAFNDYLQTGATLGFIGLAIFLLIIALAFYGYVQSKNKGLMYSLIALLVFALASYPLMLISFQIIFVLLIAVGAGNIKSPAIELNRYVLGIIAIITLMLCGYEYSTINKLEAKYKEWRSVKRIYSMGNYKGAARMFEKLYPTLSEYPDFLFEYGRSLNQTGSYQLSNQILGRVTEMSCDPMIYNIMGNNYKLMGDSNQAEQAYKKAHSIVPNRIYPLYLLAILYYDTGQTKKAMEMSQRILDFKEKIVSNTTESLKENIRSRMQSINLCLDSK